MRPAIKHQKLSTEYRINNPSLSLCTCGIAPKTTDTKIHKHTMPKRHADSTEDENPRKRRQLSADEAFVEAARNGDTTAVRAVLDLFRPDREKVSFDAAHEACRGNHDECLTLLLPYVETTQMGFGILLSECVHADRVACTEVLLQHWKSVCNNVAFVPHEANHSGGEEGDCPAMWSDPAVCGVLIDAGADLHTKNNWQESPLHYACQKGALDVVKMLVEAGAGVRVTEEDGHMCLTHAARNGRTETVRYLVGLFQVDVNHESDEGFTALHLAYEHTDVVQVLIEAGADINTESDELSPPLQCACRWGALDAVKILVRAGAVVSDTCLWRAVDQGRTETVRYLLCLPEVDVNYRNDDHKTALSNAVFWKHADVVQVLIDAGADIYAHNDERRSLLHSACTPLFSACESKSLAIVKMLVEAGVGVRDTDNEGHTCLMHAAWQGNIEIVRYLVGLPEVDLNRQSTAIADASNHTALHLAVFRKHTDVMQVLIDAGADIDAQNNEGRSPLHSACKYGTLDVVKMLVRAGAGVRVTDNDGCTCLILAARCGHTETVRYLVGLPEVELNHRDTEKNYTALQYAVDENHNYLAQMLLGELYLELEAEKSRTSRM